MTPRRGFLSLLLLAVGCIVWPASAPHAQQAIEVASAKSSAPDLSNPSYPLVYPEFSPPDTPRQWHQPQFHSPRPALLDSGISHNLISQIDGWGPDNRLIEASRGGYLGNMRKELLHGANVNAKGRGGVPPLIAAAEGGRPAAVELLLEKGALVDLYDKDRRTALSVTARNGNAEVARLLLQAGADADKYHSSRDSPLRIAVRHRHVEVVRLLLDHGADVQDTDITGRTALDHAQESRNREMIELLQMPGEAPRP